MNDALVSVAILLYRIALISLLMYTVGYLGWSAHWLWLLLTLSSFPGEVK